MGGVAWVGVGVGVDMGGCGQVWAWVGVGCYSVCGSKVCSVHTTEITSSATYVTATSKD